MNETPIVNYFNSPELNDLGAKLIELYKGAKQDLRVAQKKLVSAVERRWHAGKYVAENHDRILEEVGSQRKFAEKLGITEAMVSNDKRGYLALKEEGAETFEQAQKIMADRDIRAITTMWEKLPKLLNQPKSERVKDQRSKDEKRLEQLHGEIEEIKARNEGANPSIAERAEDTLNYSEAVVDHVKAQDVFKSGWRSREYLDWVKSLGFDYITGEPSGALDPHHTDLFNQSHGTDGKMSDIFTFPANRVTHEKLESGELNPKPIEIAEALIRTMGLYIITHKKGD